jgi:hypothetical protein
VGAPNGSCTAAWWSIDGRPGAVEHIGRRGKPVKKMRLILAERAFAFVRKLQQGTPGCTVSVC